MKYIVLFLTALVLVGCGTNAPKPLYKWENYQSAQISYSKHTDDPNALKAYEKELKKVIKTKKVPPSVYSEYALVLTKLGRKQEAREYFEKEIQTYPESEVFIKNVMKKIYGGEK